jgi:hypothetical protein
MCQWAADADETAPVEYNLPKDGEIVCRYASGVKRILREKDWLPPGSCLVRFEGDAGCVETGDSGKLILSSPELFAGHKVAEIGGFPATYQVRDFLNCVKSRGKPLANADAACYGHIACHAANIALCLDRKLSYDPVKNEFLDDDQANRLRSEAIRETYLRIAKLPGTFMATTTDLGAGGHPKNKWGYGARAARVVLGGVYRRQLEYYGPLYKSHDVQESKIRAVFSHAGQGLALKNANQLQGFTIAGADKVFHWATARIEPPSDGGQASDSMIVSSDKVPLPVAVRYDWGSEAHWANLFNKDGLPAQMFRTDDW